MTDTPVVTAKRTVVDGWIADVVALALATVVVLRCDRTEKWIDAFVDGRRGDLYAALLGLHATLLGFILAALAIVLGYVNNPNFALVRRSGKLPALFTIFLASTRTEAIATAAALCALLGDRDKHAHTLLPAILAAITLVALLRLARTLWVMRLVVLIAIRPAQNT
jgi:hypothetical protein